MDFKVSAVIPMYNAENTILRALKSIEQQTVKVDEVVIINDGSTDNSVILVNDYARTSKVKIKCLTQDNGGVSSARNFGMSSAKNDFIAFLDSDDEWCDDKLELQLPIFNDPSVVLVGGKYTPCLKKNRFFEVTPFMQLFKNRFQTSTVIIRKNALKAFSGFYIKQRYAEEGRFYFDMAKCGKLMLLDSQVVIYDGGNKRGFGESGLSANLIEMQKGELSNIIYACKIYNYSFFTKLIALLFSTVKFARRLVITFIKKR